MNHKFHILLAGLALLAAAAPGNNIAISNQCLLAQNPSARTRLLRFDLSWESSWRDNENYDAAWVFLKYSTDGGATWRHATLKSSGANPAGFSQGSGTDLDIVVPADRKGAFLQRASPGEGAVSTRGIQLVWDYGADLGNNSDALAAIATIRINAVEMVYIPAGPFYLGDYLNTYANGVSPTAQPRDSEKAQNIGPQGCQILVRSNDVHALKIKIAVPYSQTIAPFDDAANGVVGLISYFADSGGAPGSCSGIWFNAKSGIALDQPTESNLNSNWPTGLKAFYYLRYEVSQAQYRDFLNSLSPAQALERYGATANISPSTSSGQAARFGIKLDNGLYGCDLNANGVFDEADDGQCVPVTCRSANDSLALNDFSALRWVTEFEYEKAARGPNPPVKAEAANAYGGEAVVPSGYAYSGTPNEVPVNNAEDGAWVVYNAANLMGPLRCGALATASSSRKKAMAGYYGNLDLSGNVMEDVISVGTILGRAYSAAHGDGHLSTNGFADVRGWPGGELASAEPSAKPGNIPLENASNGKIPLAYRAVAQRGGEWATTPDQQTGAQPIWLSSRYCGTTLYDYDWRGAAIGGVWRYSHGLRGGRSAE